MPRCYFHVASARETIQDDEGSDLLDLGTAREEAIKDARSLMSSAILEGRDISNRSIQISGEDGKVLLVVPFRMAVAARD
jgi:ATP-dependent protease HslVU (ClpYQ) peptidase subunit